MDNSYLNDARELEADLTAFMQDIIRIPSLSSQEGNVIERIRQEMEKLDFDEVTVDPMGNLIGRIGSGPQVVALDGHVDTVDVGDRSLWDREPFSGDVEDGVLYGRGTSDMKGGVASSVYAGGLIKQRGIPDNVTLYVTATVQEEDCDGLCWQYIAKEDGIRPDLVVITEPTSCVSIAAIAGAWKCRCIRPVFPAMAPRRSVASTPCTRWRTSLRTSNRSTNDSNLASPLGKGTVTISEIRSTSPSLCAVADGCTIHLDRRLTIGETEATAVAEIEALPSVQAADATVTVLEYAVPSYTGLTYPTRKYYPTWELPEDAAGTQAALAAHLNAFETKMPKSASGCSVRMPWRRQECSEFRRLDSGRVTKNSRTRRTSRWKSSTSCAAALSIPPSWMSSRRALRRRPLSECDSDTHCHGPERPRLADDTGLVRRGDRHCAGYGGPPEEGIQERCGDLAPATQVGFSDLSSTSPRVRATHSKLA